MSGKYPKLINPLRFVEKSGVISSQVCLAGLQRLIGSLLEDNGLVDFELNFKKKDKLATIVGFIKADLVMECQICLKKLIWPVRSQINLAIVSSIDEANLLPDGYEPLLVNEDFVAIEDIIEDELILALPSVPRHQECHFQTTVNKEDILEKPFLILNQLK